MLNARRQAVCAAALLLAVLAKVAPSLGAQDAPSRKLVTRVAPIYPPVALRARLSGAVKLVAVVSPQGLVKSVRTIGGSPLFVPAAEEAVRRWKYEAAKTDTTESVVLTFTPVQ
jgi:TonB family protein